MKEPRFSLFPPPVSFLRTLPPAHCLIVPISCQEFRFAFYGGLPRGVLTMYNSTDTEVHMRLKDKVAIVTGAAQGIGAAYARGSARERAAV
jgi:hypothetical protein